MTAPVNPVAIHWRDNITISLKTRMAIAVMAWPGSETVRTTRCDVGHAFAMPTGNLFINTANLLSQYFYPPLQGEDAATCVRWWLSTENNAGIRNGG